MNKKFMFETMSDYAEYVKNQTNIVLDKCGIYGEPEERTGLLTNIKMSIKAKQKLWDIFSNHPAHNGKGQLVFPMEFERFERIDDVSNFSYYIRKVSKKMYREMVIDGETYRSLHEKMLNIERFLNGLAYTTFSYDEISINGSPLTEIVKEHEKRKEIKTRFHASHALFDTLYNSYDNTYITNESADNKYNIDKIADFINEHPHTTLEIQGDVDLINGMYDCRARIGQRMTKVVLKAIKKSGLYEILMSDDYSKAEFNRKYAKYCDAITPLIVKRWAVLSINFTDFITMSHGNSWTSCLNTDKLRKFTSGSYGRGFNSRRTLDYALDETTMVFYTISENYEGDDYELQPKITRQLFHWGEGKLVQARLYPQGDDPRREVYDQNRKVVEKAIADGLGVANIWSAPIRGTIDSDKRIARPSERYSNSYRGNYIDFFDIAQHGGEEDDFQTEVNYVILRGNTNEQDNEIPMFIGSPDAVCIMTNEHMDDVFSDAIYINEAY